MLPPPPALPAAASSAPALPAPPISSAPAAKSPRALWPYVAVAVASAGVVLGGAALLSLGSRDVDFHPPPVSSAPPAGSVASALLTPVPVEDAGAAAVPAQSASVAVPASASVAPLGSAPPASYDAAAARATLRRTVSGHDWPHADEAFFVLVDNNPGALHDPAMKAAARDTAAAAGVSGGPVANRVFVALGERFGADGLDVLYEIVRTRGGSKAAMRAQEMLRQPQVIARATPELRITVALRDAPCAEQTALLERAAAEGDARTVVVMETIVAPCLGKSGALENALKALKLRLRPR